MLKLLMVLAIPVLIIPQYACSQTNETSQTKTGQNPAQRVADSPVQQDGSTYLQAKGQQHVNADVKVIALPPKDWQDKAAFWINLALAVAGFLGIGVGIGTLIFLRGQVVEMGRQVGQMEAQLREMQKVSDIENKTLLLQYRPRIIVRNAKLLDSSFELGKPWEFQVRFQIVNTGGTPAHITAGSYIQAASVIADDVGKIKFKWGDQCFLETTTLEPGQMVTVEDSTPAGVPLTIDWQNFIEGVDIRPHHYVRFTGVIYYNDDLNIPRSTGIHRSLDPKSREFVPNREAEQEYSD